ncbi:MAG: DEAD/DEAH box helicase [Candidatus Tectomicrobia bacterium]|uniref:DEAD/DEAH box helicase n=1 Tax=Tectimicrobiota bacterium TaxID=2528274 RepID=A0A932CP32_UNCTE|nr:DEAD/DEAH box helicase [Candidatus Tectomicrobia bacterium]
MLPWVSASRLYVTWGEAQKRSPAKVPGPPTPEAAPPAAGLAEKAKKPAEVEAPLVRAVRQPPRRLSLAFSFEADGALERLKQEAYEPLELYDLRLQGEQISLFEGYDSLLCLGTLHGVESYWFQVETVKRVLKHFRGRVLLCDEVGLGKTIEAGMLLKEYLLRGLVKRILILVPPSLVSQWKEEMETKFGLEFVTTDDPDYTASPASFWRAHDRIIASINIAKSKRNFEAVSGLEHDLVVVDEAHHLKNRTSLNWKLVNALKKKFIFLLTATPVQNDLMELYNLITLLRPGTLKTPAYFRQEFMQRGDPRSPQNRERLRDLLQEVMVRNTRSLADIRLPKRYATTVLVRQEEAERELYQRLSRFVAAHYPVESPLNRFTLNLLQMEAGSSPFALRATMERLLAGGGLPAEVRRELEEMRGMAGEVRRTQKAVKLLEVLRAHPIKKLVFTKYLETQDYLCQLLRQEGIPFALLSGSLSNPEKDEQVRRFREEVDLLIATESGGEGRNLQFCNTMVNYDLPWNPMRIEQRIGRIHRIGQEREVFVFNLAGEGTVEDYLLYLLDRKINMFELVIGELEMILGYLRDERDFPEIVMDLWVRSSTPQELQESFSALGEKLLEARQAYQKTREYDEQLFSRDFEV